MFSKIKALFSFDQEKELAKQMAVEVSKAVSVKLMTERRQVLSAKKISYSLEQVYQVAREYYAERKLGTMRRAILANNLRWDLKELGYPDDFIAVVTEGLIVELDRPNKPKNKR